MKKQTKKPAIVGYKVKHRNCVGL